MLDSEKRIGFEVFVKTRKEGPYGRRGCIRNKTIELTFVSDLGDGRGVYACSETLDGVTCTISGNICNRKKGGVAVVIPEKESDN